MGAKENHVFLLFKFKHKHIEIYIEYRKHFDNIQISIFFIYRPALIYRHVEMQELKYILL